jgi:putative tryptophan/tyrosine transport system substrate-binding protein
MISYAASVASPRADVMIGAGVEAVNVLASPALATARDLMFPKFEQARLPAIYQWPEIAKEGRRCSPAPTR